MADEIMRNTKKLLVLRYKSGSSQCQTDNRIKDDKKSWNVALDFSRNLCHGYPLLGEPSVTGVFALACIEYLIPMPAVNRHRPVFYLQWGNMNTCSQRCPIDYCDVTMGAMASQITSLTIVYSTVYSGTDKKKKPSKLRVTGLCAGNSPGTGKFPAQMTSYAENVFIWWRHHEIGAANVKWTTESKKTKIHEMLLWIFHGTVVMTSLCSGSHRLPAFLSWLALNILSCRRQ